MRQLTAPDGLLRRSELMERQRWWRQRTSLWRAGWWEGSRILIRKDHPGCETELYRDEWSGTSASLFPVETVARFPLLTHMIMVSFAKLKARIIIPPCYPYHQDNFWPLYTMATLGVTAVSKPSSWSPRFEKWKHQTLLIVTESNLLKRLTRTSSIRADLRVRAQWYLMLFLQSYELSFSRGLFGVCTECQTCSRLRRWRRTLKKMNQKEVPPSIFSLRWLAAKSRLWGLGNRKCGNNSLSLRPSIWCF